VVLVSYSQPLSSSVLSRPPSTPSGTLSILAASATSPPRALDDAQFTELRDWLGWASCWLVFLGSASFVLLMPLPSRS